MMSTKKYRIAIDARLVTKTTVGIARYTINLVNELCKKTDIQLVCLVNTEDLEDILIKKGVENNIVFVKLKNKPLSLCEHLEIPFILLKHKIDLFHITSYIAPVLIPCKYIYSILDIFHLLFPKDKTLLLKVFSTLFSRVYYTLVVKPVAKRALEIITISESSKRDIAKYITDKTPITVTLLAGNFNNKTKIEFNIIKQKYKLSNAGYILFFGNHRINKNVERLLKAYSILVHDMPNAPDLVLNLKHEKRWEACIGNAAAAGKCKFIGYIEEEDTFSIFKHALFLSAPSLYEGFGLFILEAMNAEIPVLTSNASCLPEIAGEAALLVNPYSEREIVSGMKQLIQNPELRNRLVEKGIRRRTEFSWDRCANETYEVYMRSLSWKS